MPANQRGWAGERFGPTADLDPTRPPRRQDNVDNQGGAASLPHVTVLLGLFQVMAAGADFVLTAPEENAKRGGVLKIAGLGDQAHYDIDQSPIWPTSRRRRSRLS